MSFNSLVFFYNAKSIDMDIDQIEQKGNINYLPDEMIHNIFSYLTLQDIGNCRSVDKKWSVIASDKKILLNAIKNKVQEEWGKLSIDIGEISLPPENIIDILLSNCPIWEGKKVWQTHLVEYLPRTINNNDLSINSIEEIIQPKLLLKLIFSNSRRNTIPYPRSNSPRWGLMTKNPHPDSYDNVDQVTTIIDNFIEKTGKVYHVPKTLDASIFFIKYYFKNKKNLTATICQETNPVERNRHLEIIPSIIDSEEYLLISENFIGYSTGVSLFRELNENIETVEAKISK